MIKYIVILAIVLASSLVTSCAPHAEYTIKGELFQQSIDEQFGYDVATYTLITSESQEGDNFTQNFYEFKVRDGYYLPLWEYYIFEVEYISDGEFLLKSVKQIAK